MGACCSKSTVPKTESALRIEQGNAIKSALSPASSNAGDLQTQQISSSMQVKSKALPDDELSLKSGMGSNVNTSVTSAIGQGSTMSGVASSRLESSMQKSKVDSSMGKSQLDRNDTALSVASGMGN
jgi:hypothetical protein